MRRTDRRKCFFRFITPSGTVVKGINLKAFCETNSLEYKAMKLLRLGKIVAYKGWCKNMVEYAKLNRWIVNMETGERVSLRNSIASICRHYNLAERHLQMLVNGKKLKYLNWVLDVTFTTLYGGDVKTSGNVLKALDNRLTCENVGHGKIQNNSRDGELDSKHSTEGTTSSFDDAHWLGQDEVQRDNKEMLATAS